MSDIDHTVDTTHLQPAKRQCKGPVGPYANRGLLASNTHVLQAVVTTNLLPGNSCTLCRSLRNAMSNLHGLGLPNRSLMNEAKNNV